MTQTMVTECRFLQISRCWETATATKSAHVVEQLCRVLNAGQALGFEHRVQMDFERLQNWQVNASSWPSI